MTTETTETTDTLKARYNFACAVCGYEMSAGPSLAMRCGENFGAGRCVNCKAYLHLEITPDLSGETMQSELFTQHMARAGRKDEV